MTTMASVTSVQQTSNSHISYHPYKNNNSQKEHTKLYKSMLSTCEQDAAFQKLDN